MIYISSPIDQAYETYFVGVILILITLFSWTYLKLRISVPLALISILGYAYIEVIDRGMELNSREAALVTNIFLLGSAAIIGFIAQVMRDRYIRENYLLQQSLKEAYKAKAEEAKDNEYLANHDPLTGLPNRRYMTELLEASMKEAEEKDKVLVIMFLDLNGFKQVNDIYGHAAGDKVLKVVAKRLELAIRRGDHIARLGGDEYLIGLMMDKDHLGEAENMTEKFAAIIAQPMNIEGIRVRVGSSIGLSAYPIHGNQISVLLDIADKRMYAAKKGRPPISVGSSYQQKDNKVAVFPGKKV
ncbi:GGDEF domain-containing protein [Cocleimonas sp. KMM 6896]|nr:GGDEF domain-containing protein [Cocleimonas sp. KMM 6896]